MLGVRAKYVTTALQIVLFGTVTYYGFKWIVDALDPTKKSRLKAQQQAEQLLKKIGLKGIKLSEYELFIASDLIDPLTISVSWKDIGGLKEVIEEVKETVILPLQQKDIFNSSVLLTPPKGILLYGPPGCGKTMVAKATAKEAGCRFLNLQVSSLTDKWYGESQKLASAVFSLAIKLQPCIIFIDEIDSFLRARQKYDHEATAMMKAQFMSLWDGLVTDSSCQVIVMGATNRPQDVDRAILRRMPSTFRIGLPNIQQREEILRIILSKENLAEDVDLEFLAKMMEGLSGSDLKEVCRTAAMSCVRDYLKDRDPQELSASNMKNQLRPITHEDLLAATERLSTAAGAFDCHDIAVDF